MSRAAALLLLAMICGIASYQWRIGAGSNPASIQPKMRDNMTEAHAEIILTNGRIYTGDPKLPWASSVAIRGESIAAVAASDADLKSFRGPKTRIIDLHGQF